MSDEQEEGCGTCGAAVIDEDKHREWHQGLVAEVLKVVQAKQREAADRYNLRLS